MMSLRHPAKTAKAEAQGIRMSKSSSRQASDESRQKVNAPQTAGRSWVADSAGAVRAQLGQAARLCAATCVNPAKL